MKTTGLVLKPRRYIGSVEPPATVLEDESRYGNNGTFEGDGNPNWVQLTSGLWVLSYVTGDTIEIASATPPSLDFAAGQAWSVVGWFYHTSSPSGANNFFMGQHEYYGICFRKTSDNTYQFREEDGDYHVLLADATPYDAVWTHLGWVSNGTTITLYINGVIDGVVTPTATTLEIHKYGSSHDTGTYSYEGMVLADVYNYALSVEKIASFYQAERAWFGV